MSWFKETLTVLSVLALICRAYLIDKPRKPITIDVFLISAILEVVCIYGYWHWL